MKFSVLISALAASSLSSFVFAPRAQALIVGGVDMTAHDPIQNSTAALYEPSSNGPGGALCTASLIGKNMAVTAAHCLQPGGYSPVMIFGSNVRSPESVQRPVTGSVINPAYGSRNGMDQGDIAVVKFGGGLPAGYKPATLDSADDKIQKGESAILAGYGVNDASTKEGAGILRKTSVDVSNARTGKSEMILDQTHGRGACHGDSGGPAYVMRGGKMVLAGVTNRSYPNSASDDCAHKVVYTKIAAYRPWISQSAAQLNRSPSSAAMTAPIVGARMLSSTDKSNPQSNPSSRIAPSRGASPVAESLGATTSIAKSARRGIRAHKIRGSLAASRNPAVQNKRAISVRSSRSSSKSRRSASLHTRSAVRPSNPKHRARSRAARSARASAH